MTETAQTRTFLTRQLTAAAVVLALATATAPRAEALVVLEDGTSRVEIDETSQTGLSFWTTFKDGVGVVDNVEKEWFWFRTGSMTSEASIDTLTLNGASDLNNVVDNNARLIYDDPGGAFRVQVDLLLTGGAPTSPDTLVERIDIFNLSGSPLDFVFFEYTDFDLGGTANDDNGSFPGSFNVSQTDQNNPFHFLDTVAGTAPTERAIVGDGSILTSLIDGALTNLNSIDAAPVANANVSWAFQWNYTQGSSLGQIGPNSSVGFSKTKTLAPEPGTAALAALGLLGLALYGRKP